MCRGTWTLFCGQIATRLGRATPRAIPRAIPRATPRATPRAITFHMSCNRILKLECGVPRHVDAGLEETKTQPRNPMWSQIERELDFCDIITTDKLAECLDCLEDLSPAERDDADFLLTLIKAFTLRFSNEKRMENVLVDRLRSYFESKHPLKFASKRLRQDNKFLISAMRQMDTDEWDGLIAEGSILPKHIRFTTYFQTMQLRVSDASDATLDAYVASLLPRHKKLLKALEMWPELVFRLPSNLVKDRMSVIRTALSNLEFSEQVEQLVKSEIFQMEVPRNTKQMTRLAVLAPCVMTFLNTFQDVLLADKTYDWLADRDVFFQLHAKLKDPIPVTLHCEVVSYHGSDLAVMRVFFARYPESAFTKLHPLSGSL